MLKQQRDNQTRSAAIRELRLNLPPLPANPEAEESVIGQLLLDGRSIVGVIDILSASDFFAPALEAIYGAMVSLARPTDGEPPVPIDVLTVEERLTNLGLMDKLPQGRLYFTTLLERVVSTDNLLSHVQIVRKYARARAAMARGMDLLQAPTVQEFDQWMREQAAALADLAHSHTGTEPLQVRGDLQRLVKEVEERFDGRTVRSLVSGVPTGIDEFDRMTGGLQAEFILVAGRPSMGKSALMCCWAAHAALHNVPTLVFSLEMTRMQVVSRIACIRGHIPTEAMRTGLLQTREWVRLAQALGELSDAPLYLDDTPATIATLRDKARRWRRKYSQPQCHVCGALLPDGYAAECGLCNALRPPSGWRRRRALVIVDYLGRIPVRVRPGGSDEKALADLSRQLKDLPAELDAAVVVLTQLNRKCEERKDKRPQPSDLRDSGALEQDADVIVLLYRDEVYNPDTDKAGVMEMIIGKQRNGPTGTVEVTYVAAEGPRIENRRAP